MVKMMMSSDARAEARASHCRRRKVHSDGRVLLLETEIRMKNSILKYSVIQCKVYDIHRYGEATAIKKKQTN